MSKKTGYPTMQGFRLITAILLVSLLSTIHVKAQDTKGQTVMSSMTTTATVTKINQKTREVTIKMSDGQEHSFVASDHVKNLAQVKKGDVITITYTQALAYQLRKHGAPGVTTTQAVASADSGAKPAGAVAQQTTVTVKITAIDTSIPTVTVMGPRGNTETIVVRDPQKLNGVKVGDMVDITYTEAIALEVNKEAKK